METNILNITETEVNQVLTYQKCTIRNDGNVPFVWNGLLKLLAGDSIKLAKSKTPVTMRIIIVFEMAIGVKSALVTYS